MNVQLKRHNVQFVHAYLERFPHLIIHTKTIFTPHTHILSLPQTTHTHTLFLSLSLPLSLTHILFHQQLPPNTTITVGVREFQVDHHRQQPPSNTVIIMDLKTSGWLSGNLNFQASNNHHLTPPSFRRECQICSSRPPPPTTTT